jgi:uncharacterized protein
MNKDIERRYWRCDLRVEDRADKPPVIRGTAAVFNQLSEDLGGFREQLQTGAFAEALQSSDVRALFNHDGNIVLGRNGSGTLRMHEDAHGLQVEIDPPPTQAARDLVELMKRGDVNQMSFAFTVSKEDQQWTRDGSGPWIRIIKKVARLFDVSVVTYPAYPQTSAAARALQDLQDAEAARAEAEAAEARGRESVARQIQLARYAIA